MRKQIFCLFLIPHNKFYIHVFVTCLPITELISGYFSNRHVYYVSEVSNIYLQETGLAVVVCWGDGVVIFGVGGVVISTVVGCVVVLTAVVVV